MVEINRGNIEKHVRFSSKGLNDIYRPRPNPIDFEKDVTAEDVVKAINGSVEDGISIEPALVIAALNQLPFTYKQVGKILEDCTEGLIRVKEKKADWYYVKLHEMSAWRQVRREAEKIFDTEINK